MALGLCRVTVNVYGVDKGKPRGAASERDPELGRCEFQGLQVFFSCHKKPNALEAREESGLEWEVKE